MRKIIAFGLFVSWFAAAEIPALADEKSQYVDGNVPGLKVKTEGVTHADGPVEFVFEWKKGALKIPFLQINGLKYGKSSHMSVRYGFLTGVHPAKVSEYRLIIEYADGSNATHTAVFKIGRDRLWNTLVNLHSKSGKTIEFDSAEACHKAMKDAPPGQLDCPPDDSKGKGK